MKIITLFFLISASVFLFNCQSDQSYSTSLPVGTITVRADAEVLTVPNQATISVSLQCLDKNITKSRDCLIDKSANLTESLKKFGVEQTDIQTTAVNQYKDYQWQRNSQVFVGYRSSLNLVVEVQNIAVLEEIYPLLLSDEDTNIGQLSYSHNNLDSLSQVAYSQALKKANAIAKGMLGAMGKDKVEILRIANVPLQGQTSLTPRNYPGDAMVEEAMAVPTAAPRMNVNSGQIKITEAVYVEYAVK
jgi:uncharacterized protein YggE